MLLQTVSVQCCRTCLATDVRMCPLERYGLGRSYTTLVGHAFDEDDGLPEAVCYMCAQRLDAFRIFRKRSRRAHAVLQGLLEEHGEITASSFRKIDRTPIGLMPSLLCYNLKPIIIEPTFNSASYFNLKLEQEEPGSKDFEVDVDTGSEVNEMKVVEFEFKSKPEHCADNVDYYVSFIPGPKGEDSNARPESNKSNKKLPKVEKVAPKRKLVKKTATEGERQTRDDGPKKVKRVRKVKTENGDEVVPSKEKANEAIKVKSDVKKPARKKKRPIHPRLRDIPRILHTAEYYDSFATVTVMTEEEQVECFSQRQNSERYKNAQYKCTDCFAGFITRACYDTHRDRHDDASQGSEVCKICKVRLRTKYLLTKHLATNHRTKFECKKCLHVCTSGLQARAHQSTKHTDKLFPCSDCGTVFKREISYRLHRNKMHPPLLACLICGLTYTGHGAMNRHRANKHSGVDSANCKVLCECGTRFLSEEARSVHRSSHPQHADLDGNTSTVYCEFCDEKFTNLEATLKHRVSHTQTALRMEERECEQCGVMLSGQGNYVRHFRSAHPDKVPTSHPSHLTIYSVMCELCGKVYQGGSQYNTHIKIHHHGETPYKCEVCNKSYANAHILKEHRRIHTNEKPHECNVCNRKFSQKSNLVRHRAVHTDVAPFSCDICGRYFKYRHVVRNHIQYVHLKKPWPKRDRTKRNQKTSDSD